MSLNNNIRFRVHSRRNVGSNMLEQKELISEVLFSDVSNNQIEALLSMLNATNSMINNFEMVVNDNLPEDNILSEFQFNDPIEIALRNSMEGQEHKRCIETVVNVKSQSYETTEKKFDSCSICTDNYKNNEIVSVLDCGHVFHNQCITEWGHYHPSCPVCKKGIPTI